MATIFRYHLAVLTVALLIPFHQQRVSADEPALKREELLSIQEATRDVAREVESLQDILSEQRVDKEQSLYQQADAVLAEIEGFQKLLKSETSRMLLNKAFDERDVKLHELLKALQNLGPEQRLLKRSAAKVRVADDQVHYLLSVGDTSESRTKQVLERQTRTLLDAAQQLEKTGDYSLGAVPGRGVLIGDLRKLAAEAEQFQKGLAAGKDRAQLRKDFAAVNRVWVQSIQGMGNLKVGDHMHLLRAASHFDRIHERLYRLLGIEGERPQLTIRT